MNRASFGDLPLSSVPVMLLQFPGRLLLEVAPLLPNFQKNRLALKVNLNDGCPSCQARICHPQAAAGLPELSGSSFPQVSENPQNRPFFSENRRFQVPPTRSSFSQSASVN